MNGSTALEGATNREHAGGSNEEILSPEELLGRLARTLRNDIAPAVGDTFPRTQAFMAAVILEKLSTQLRNAAADAEATGQERTELVADLPSVLGAGPGATLPDRCGAALAALAAEPGDRELAALVQSLYDDRASLGEERFAAGLARVRRTLRADLDRRLVVAR